MFNAYRRSHIVSQKSNYIQTVDKMYTIDNSITHWTLISPYYVQRDMENKYPQ